MIAGIPICDSLDIQRMMVIDPDHFDLAGVDEFLSQFCDVEYEYPVRGMLLYFREESRIDPGCRLDDDPSALPDVLVKKQE